MMKRDTLMSEQGSIQVYKLHRPANDDKETWKAYWKAQGQLWQWEPEIDEERQKYLAERRKIELTLNRGFIHLKTLN